MLDAWSSQKAYERYHHRLRPAGYTAGLYAARAMLEPLMFAGYMSGGQLMLTSDIENFPGYPKGIGGPEMMMELREQAERFGLEVHDKERRFR
ncbi:MAG: hypothetical protein CM15mP128_5510 [Methanobacteriota archaeon]|nr:MAG: hypothetical protein CM15mP128_5510 [Euryarchaeota archaeon]